MSDLQQQIDELRTELTSVQTALSLVLSAEHRELVNSKDVKKVFQEIVQELRQDEEYERNLMAQKQMIRQQQAEMELARARANMQAGLQGIGSTTFGTLSQAELDKWK
nr:hypothetical protein [Desulfobacteraceae bacterium]